jgi:hypothetical protein
MWQISGILDGPGQQSALTLKRAALGEPDPAPREIEMVEERKGRGVTGGALETEYDAAVRAQKAGGEKPLDEEQAPGDGTVIPVDPDRWRRRPPPLREGFEDVGLDSPFCSSAAFMARATVRRSSHDR